MADNKPGTISPWVFIPTLYFAQGLPYAIINNFSVVMFKSLGVSNELIGFTTILSLPWTLKPLWGPLVDSIGTKRNWLVYMQLALSIMFLISSLALNLSFFFVALLIIFSVSAFISATHDIATDGFYLHVLDKGNQAFFTGIRSTFFRLAMVFGGGILVTIAGGLGESTGNAGYGWSLALVLSGVILLLFFVHHRFILPCPVSDKPVKSKTQEVPFFESFREYFRQDKIWVVLGFILTYRLGEGLLIKMVQPFLLDGRYVGGLGASVSEVGTMYGIMGVVSLLAGGILGGVLLKYFNLKKILFPLALTMHLPNLLFLYLAVAQPTHTTTIDLSFLINFISPESSISVSINPVAQLCIIAEQFGYGLGFSGFMVYLLYISKGKYKTSHYALSTGFMALGMLVPGFFSGLLQQAVGYPVFFLISFIATIPGMVLLFFLPGTENKGD